MSSAFSSNDADCVTRGVELPISEITKEHIWNDLRMEECVQWIKLHSFARVQYKTSIIVFIHVFLSLNKASKRENEIFCRYVCSFPTICCHLVRPFYRI